MSLAVNLPQPIPPPILLDPPKAKPTRPDKTTPAVLRYLAAMRSPITSAQDLKAQRTTLTHLVRICRCFCRGLYLWNGSQGVHEVQWAECQGQGKHVVVREWIEEWLLAQLSRHYSQTSAEIQAAAVRGDFRWLGVHCRQALLKEVRARTLDDGFPRVAVSLSHSYEDDDPDADLLLDFVTGPRLNLDSRYDPGDLLQIVEDNRTEFERLGVFDVLHELVRGRNLEGDETLRVAAKLNIGERQARNRITECRKVMKAAADTECVGRRRLPWEVGEQVEQLCDSGVKKLFNALRNAGEPNHARYELGITESPDSRSRRRLLSEAAKDMWAGVSARGIQELQAEEQAAQRNEDRTRAVRRASMVDPIDGLDGEAES
jgi:hypothetical protein